MKWLNATEERATSITQALRNPLASVEAFAALLKQALAGEAERAVIREHALCGMKSLNQTIAHLLLYTKLPLLQLMAVSSHQLLENPLVFTNHRSQYDHLSLHKYFVAKGVPIHADAELLKQVFLKRFFHAIQTIADGSAFCIGRHEKLSKFACP